MPQRWVFACAGGVSLLLWAGATAGAGAFPYKEVAMPVSNNASEGIFTGLVIKGGVECPLFRTDGGETFTLMGVGGPDRFEPGERLRITGRPAAASTCMQGKSLIVESAEVLAE